MNKEERVRGLVAKWREMGEKNASPPLMLETTEETFALARIEVAAQAVYRSVLSHSKPRSPIHAVRDGREIAG